MEEILRENWLVVERIYDDEDAIIKTEPRQRIKNVPDGVTIKALKDLLDETGHSQYRWGLHTVEPETEWNSEAIGDYEHYGQEIRDADLQQMSFLAADLDYEELVDKRNDEKRITLRLPNSLHYALSQAAVAVKVTLNSYCIKVLADEVGYGDKLEDFEAHREANRRKPGRPKKVQDSE